MSSNILADRTNCQPKVIESSEKEKPKTMEYHRQILESRIKDGQWVNPQSIWEKSDPNYLQSAADLCLSLRWDYVPCYPEAERIPK